MVGRLVDRLVVAAAAGLFGWSAAVQGSQMKRYVIYAYQARGVSYALQGTALCSVDRTHAQEGGMAQDGV